MPDMAETMKRALSAVLFGVADTLFPSRCAACDAAVDYRERSLCASCRGDIERVGERCPRCSGFLADGGCGVCSSRAWYVDANVTAAEYRGTMRRVLREFKFNNRPGLAAPLAELACAALASARETIAPDVVTAVPASRRQKWKRGYNQSELVARRIARNLTVPYVALLRERGGALSQKRLRYRDRFLNILGRFAVRRTADVAGMRILIVDDIFTTGATINECARILKEAGACAVYGMALARAADHALADADAQFGIPQRSDKP